MDPVEILATLRAFFEAVREVVLFLQTPNGEKVIAQMFQDRANWDSFWNGLFTNVQTFFKGGWAK